MEPTNEMRCIVMNADQKFTVETRPIPKPKSGEVLIKVMAAPINPSDLAFFLNQYDTPKKPPCVPGFEGSGLVV